MSKSRVNRHSHQYHLTSQEVFKEIFKEGFLAYQEKAKELAKEKRVSTADTWKDITMGTSLGAGSVIFGSVIGALSTLSIIAAGPTAGVSIVAGLVVIGVGVTYGVVHSLKKAREYKRASKLMSHDEFEDDVEKIASLLAEMYDNQLDKCTHKDAGKFARACLAAIIYNLQKNKTMLFSELLHAPLLQGLLMKSIKKIPKEKLQMEDEADQSCNTRSMISKAVVLCEENDRFYECDKLTRPTKYGVVLFKTKSEVEEYTKLIAEENKKLQFKELHTARGEVLKRESFFKPESKLKEKLPVNDEMFEDKEEIDSSSLEKSESESKEALPRLTK